MSSPGSLTVQLRTRIPAPFEHWFSQCPPMLDAISSLALRFLEEQPRTILQKQRVLGRWEAMCQQNADLAHRLQLVAQQAKIECHEHDLVCPHILQWCADAPKWADCAAPSSPDEPLPFELEQSLQLSRTEPKDLLVDLLLMLTRLKHDANLAEWLEVHHGKMHPEMEVLWSNICLALFEQSPASAERQLLLEALTAVPVPLRTCTSDGLNPLMRLAETGCSATTLMALVESHPESAQVISAEGITPLLLTLASKGMWGVLRLLRTRGWEGNWPEMGRQFALDPRGARLHLPDVVNLLKAGLKTDQIVPHLNEAGDQVSVLTQCLLHEPESFWPSLRADPAASSSSGSAEAQTCCWLELWSLLTPEEQGAALHGWLGHAQILTRLGLAERVVVIDWLLEASKQVGIDSKSIRWPAHWGWFSSPVVQVLLGHQCLSMESQELVRLVQRELMVGCEDELSQLFCTLEENGVQRTTLEQTLLEACQEPFPVFQTSQGQHRHRVRLASQTLVEIGWWNSNKGTPLSAGHLVRTAMRRLTIDQSTFGLVPLNDVWGRQAIRQATSDAIVTPFRTAWNAQLDGLQGPQAWSKAQFAALSHWLDVSPLEARLVRGFVILWADLLCLRARSTPPMHWRLPTGPIGAEELADLLQQIQQHVSPSLS
jgi:hypothetical protein